jgi:hypothetical protein
VVKVVKGIGPLSEVMGVRKNEVLTSEGGGGGRIPPLVVVLMGVQGLSDEVETFSSIFSHRTSRRSEDVTSGGTI